MSVEIRGKNFKNYDEGMVYTTKAGIAIEIPQGSIDLNLGEG